MGLICPIGPINSYRSYPSPILFFSGFVHGKCCFRFCEGAFLPVGAAGSASLVAPDAVADAETLVLFYALAADIAVVFPHLFKKGFRIVECFLRGHRSSFDCKNTRRMARLQGISRGIGGRVMYHSLCQEQKLGYHHSEEPFTVQNYD